MKKILSVFCALILVMQVLYVPALAVDSAEYDVVFQLATGITGKPGDTVEVALSVVGESSLKSIAFDTFDYDSQAIELVGFTITNADINSWLFKTVEIDENDAKDSYIVLGNSQAANISGEIGILQFKIADDAFGGTYPVHVDSTVGSSSNETPSVVNSGSIIVDAPTPPTEIVFDLSDVSTESGTTVEIELSAQQSDIAYDSIAFDDLSYDESVLEFVGFTETNANSTIVTWDFQTFHVDGKNSYIVLGDGDAVGGVEGKICKLQFNVLASAADGSYDVTLTSLVKNGSDEVVSRNPVVGTITVTHVHRFDGEGVVTTAPTCTETGVMTYTCPCGKETKTEEIPANGHTYDATVTAPSCTEDGYTTHVCSVCGDTYTDTTVAALGHAWDDGVVTTEPTCTEKGVKTFTCATCAATYTEEVAALGHSYDEGVVTAPTCTAEGYTTYTCSVCGHSYTDNVTEMVEHTWDEGVVTTPATCEENGVTTYTCTVCKEATKTEDIPTALGHSYDDGVVTTEPTCTEEGVKTFTCASCGGTKTEAIAALGHTWGEEEVITEPTCTETGLKAAVCEVCDEEDTGIVIPALGHDWDDGVVTTEPTCTAVGIKTFTCNVCDATETEDVPMVEHTYTAVVTAPTCTEEGYTTYTCECGATYTADEVDALGHDYDDGVVTTEPTCTEKGVKTFTCATCGDTYTEEVAALGHTWGDEEVITEPTCTETGLKAAICEVCGEEDTGIEIPALGHSYDDGVVTTEPTCTEKGVKTFTCATCGDTYTEDVAALGHSHDDGVVTTEPTCTEKGVKTFTCATCGETYTEEIPMLAHTYGTATIKDATCTEDGSKTYTCTVCGNEVVEVIKAIGHVWGEWTVVEEATEEAAGSEERVCSVCGDKEVRDIAQLDDNKWDYIINSMKYYTMTQKNNTFEVKLVASEGGEVDGPALVKYGKSASYDIIPEDGYDVVSVLVNGKEVGAVYEVTLENVRKNQKIEVTFEEIVDVDDVIDEAIEDVEWVNPFVDIADDADYIAAIEYVYENGLFKGVSATQFAPDTTMTRAMFVTVLGRLHGIDEEDYNVEVTFEDVVLGEWYAPYVAWAAENGIVNGYSATEFGVNDEITVEQATAIIARYAAFIEIDTDVDYDLAEDYADAEDVADWAVESMAWAVAEGVYVTEDTLEPQAPATRALVASMLYNFAE